MFLIFLVYSPSVQCQIYLCTWTPSSLFNSKNWVSVNLLHNQQAKITCIHYLNWNCVSLVKMQTFIDKYISNFWYFLLTITDSTTCCELDSMAEKVWWVVLWHKLDSRTESADWKLVFLKHFILHWNVILPYMCTI